MKIHGYPKETNKFHWKAKNSFPTIIGHNHNYNAQEELLPFLIKANDKGHCDLGEIVWILKEMHESKFNQVFIPKSEKYTSDQEFDEVCKALGIKLEDYL